MGIILIFCTYTMGFTPGCCVWVGLTFTLFLCVTVLKVAFEKKGAYGRGNKIRGLDSLAARSLKKNLFLSDKKIDGGCACICEILDVLFPNYYYSNAG